MIMDNGLAGRVATVARAMLDEERWQPAREVSDRLLDLERFLAIRIQTGQPALEAMNARLVTDAAASVTEMASLAMSQGVVSGPLPREIALFGRPPAPRLVDDAVFGLFAQAA